MKSIRVSRPPTLPEIQQLQNPFDFAGDTTPLHSVYGVMEAIPVGTKDFCKPTLFSLEWLSIKFSRYEIFSILRNIFTCASSPIHHLHRLQDSSWWISLLNEQLVNASCWTIWDMRFLELTTCFGSKGLPWKPPCEELHISAKPKGIESSQCNYFPIIGFDSILWFSYPF